MNRLDLQDKLEEFSHHPTDDMANFNLGLEYEKIMQWASAFSFYMRAAENSFNDDLKYECLIRASIMIKEQGKRHNTQECMLRHAISIYPQYVEAYFFLIEALKAQNNTKDIRTIAELAVDKEEFGRFKSVVGYPGREALMFEQALSYWYTGMYEKAREMLNQIKYHHNIAVYDREHVENTLEKFGYPHKVPFNKKYNNMFKRPFPGLEKINRNFSNHMQDIFVLMATKGKRKGTYLEIGAGDPFEGNNTYLLESQFEWTGISVEMDRNKCQEFYNRRDNTVLCRDSLTIDYKEMLAEHCMPYNIDYLQIDCDEASYETLRRIPFDDYKFGVITFEHDAYRFDQKIRDYSRNILTEQGYFLVADNISYLDKLPHEDWWVHPDIIGEETAQDLKNRRSLNQIIPYFYKMHSSFYYQKKSLEKKKNAAVNGA